MAEKKVEKVEMKTLVTAFKKDADINGEDLVKTKIYGLLKKLADGNELTAEEKEYVFLGLVNARHARQSGTEATSYGCALNFWQLGEEIPRQVFW